MKKLFLIIAAQLFMFVPCFAGSLDSLSVYPNPVESKLGHTALTFGNVSSPIDLKVYKLTGALVYENKIAVSGNKAVWDLKNKDGENLTTGVYFYSVTDESGSKKTGKFAVIR